eukprot:TRINITY_DN40185_c0_g1_i1.p1 TRINITY_DN40185_c0_g1~~TRINITY_DN40185_c0_g1_i1.p1  ORF type:complete len:1080 (+),score=259.97 TRINITY_DN40185_c0_g1_i1:55-3240(+)
MPPRAQTPGAVRLLGRAGALTAAECPLARAPEAGSPRQGSSGAGSARPRGEAEPEGEGAATGAPALTPASPHPDLEALRPVLPPGDAAPQGNPLVVPPGRPEESRPPSHPICSHEAHSPELSRGHEAHSPVFSSTLFPGSVISFPATPAPHRSGEAGEEFPTHPLRVPELALRRCEVLPEKVVAWDDRTGTYSIALPRPAGSPGAPVRVHGRVSAAAVPTMHRAERRRVGVPRSARRFVWLYPPPHDRSALDGLPETAPVRALIAFGGFVYLSAAGDTVAAHAVAPGKGIAFAPPRRWIPECLGQVRGRLVPTTIQTVRDAGALWYCWLRPGEQFALPGGGVFSDWPHGAFLYCFAEALGTPSAQDCYVPLTGTAVRPVPEGDFKAVPVFQASYYVHATHCDDELQEMRVAPRRRGSPRGPAGGAYRRFATEGEAAGHAEGVGRELAAAERALLEMASSSGVDALSPAAQRRVAELCAARQLRYVDLSFPPQRAVAGSRFGERYTLPPPAFLAPGSDPTLFSTFGSSSSIEPADICQGELNDCWVLGAAAAAAEFPDLICKLFPQADPGLQDCARGRFTVRLCKGGWWRDVTLDAYLPCGLVREEGGKGHYFRPAFGRNAKQVCELWVALLEKAMAKTCTSYAEIEQGNPTEALSELTGFPTEKLPEEDDMRWNDPSTYPRCPESLRPWLGPSGKDTPFERLEELDRARCLMCLYTDCDDALLEKLGKAYRDVGLFPDHAYTLLCAKTVPLAGGGRLRLCRLRNPHGRHEWSGDWSDLSGKWDKHPEVREFLNGQDDASLHVREVGEGGGLDNGLFWMEWADVCRYFQGGGVCFLRPEWHNVRVRVSLDPSHPAACGAMLVTVHHPATCHISMHRVDKRSLPPGAPGRVYAWPGQDPSESYPPLLLRVWAPRPEGGYYERPAVESSGGLPFTGAVASLWYTFASGCAGPYVIQWLTLPLGATVPTGTDRTLPPEFRHVVLQICCDSRFATLRPVRQLGSGAPPLALREGPPPRPTGPLLMQLDTLETGDMRTELPPGGAIDMQACMESHKGLTLRPVSGTP